LHSISPFEKVLDCVAMLTANGQRALNQNYLSMMCAGPSEHDGTSTPEVHGFCDSQGAFHAFEGPEGRRMVMVMKALEEKILAQVETTLVGMRKEIQQNKSKSEAQSWMLKNIVAEQKDLSTRIDTLGAEAFESRSDLMAEIDEVSREALESRSDLIARAEEISKEAFEARIDCLASLDELDTKLKAWIPLRETQLEQDMLSEVPATVPGEAEMQQLEESRAKISDLVAKLQDKANTSNLLAGLQSAVTTATNESTAKSDAALHRADEVFVAESDAALHQAPDIPAKQQTACDLDLSDHVSSSNSKESKDLGAWLQHPGLRAAEAPYSSKLGLKGELFANAMKMTAAPSMAFNKRPPLAAPTFNLHRPRPVTHMTSSQSMPFLAPLF